MAAGSAPKTDLPAGGPDDEPAGLDEIAGPEPTPEFAAEFAEAYRRLFEGLARRGLAADRGLETGGLHRRRNRGEARLCTTDGGPAAGTDPNALERRGPLKLLPRRGARKRSIFARILV